MLDSAKEAPEVILSIEEQTMMKCITLLWTWWRERNRIREGESGRGVVALIHSIESYAAKIIKSFIHKTSQLVR
jgi:hypothetical protein